MRRAAALDHAALQARLVTVLSTDHAGRARGIHARDLARKLGVSERLLRTLISAARYEAIAICGTPATGYFVARTAEEVAESAAFWELRAKHSLGMAARVRRVSIPELLGQLQLHEG